VGQIYYQSAEEIVDKFEKFLKDNAHEGDISADAIAGAWNMIAYKQEWQDRLVAVEELKELENPSKTVGYEDEE